MRGDNSESQRARLLAESSRRMGRRSTAAAAAAIAADEARTRPEDRTDPVADHLEQLHRDSITPGLEDADPAEIAALRRKGIRI